jgi:2-oxoglutarate dehydrogenase E2 component (dihydrolipoamide succinyltransferase)
MPQMGVSVAEGTILKWHKREGDRVEADEVICEISTDKVDTEVPSPAGGRLGRILVRENETVAVGTVLAHIETGERTGASRGTPSRANGGRPDRSNGGEPDRSHVISPVVRRIADEHGIDLSAVRGTGVGGRIRKKDLLAFLEQKKEPAAAEPAAGFAPAREPAAGFAPAREPAAGFAPARPPAEAGFAPARPLHSESPYRPEAGDGHPGERREPLSPIRRQIAEHMVRSRRTAAHCTTVAEVDMTRVVARRAELKPSFEARGASITVLAFVARATVAALREQPVLNASLDGEELVHHEDVNLGIAVALDDGLIVPVIRQAQRLSLEGLAAAIEDLSARARSKRLSPDDVQGGTFTITNPGRFGTVLATPIINQPQVAILDLEAVVKRPVVVEGQDGDSIAIRPIANLCLSFDHRALDGAEAARFLGRVKALLEGPEASAP